MTKTQYFTQATEKVAIGMNDWLHLLTWKSSANLRQPKRSISQISVFTSQYSIGQGRIPEMKQSSNLNPSRNQVPCCIAETDLLGGRRGATTQSITMQREHTIFWTEKF